MLAVVAESLDAVVVPDKPSPIELALLEQLSLADAETQAALAVVRGLVELLDKLGGYRTVPQQYVVTDAKRLLERTP